MKKYVNEMEKLKGYEICGIDKAYEKLEEIAEAIKIPEKLYRYRPLNIYTIDEIVNQHVFLSSPNIDDLFDTSIVNNGNVAEGALAAYHFAKYYREKFPEMDKSFKYYTEYFGDLNKKMRKSVRITCFTESNTNVPMWQYYAEKHTGVCMEYSISKENFGENTYFLPVIYTNDYNKYLPYDLGENEKYKLVSIICSVLKMEEWKFEKEWRIVSLDNEKLEKEPYINLEISGIYCGVEMPEPIKSVLKGLIGKKIPIYEMKKEVTGLEIYKLR